MKREAASIRCPECGGEMSGGGSSNFLRWCDDPREKTHMLLCEACGYIFMPGKRDAIEIVKEVAEIDFKKCVYCGECVRVCPVSVGVADREGCTIFIGGNAGRHPRLAYKLLDLAGEETVFCLIENSIELFEVEGEGRERFGRLIERIGLGESIRRLLP